MTADPRIRLERCILRPWLRGDEIPLARHANNRRTWLNLRDAFPHPYSLQDARTWIESTLGVEPASNLAIEIDGAAAGSVGVFPLADVHRRTFEIGFWLAEPYWGRGVMTEVVRSATERTFTTFDAARIQAGVFSWNPASMRVLEKAGYVLEGWLRKSVTKDGQLLDTALYARTRT